MTRVDSESIHIDGLRYPIVGISHFEEDTPEMDANAELITEAFNVTHETGLTPRELARDREELAAAVLAWWKNHEFDERCGCNIYSEDPEFVTIAQRLTKP